MTTKFFDNLFIRSPDSLGDILAINGAYHHFIEKSNSVVIGINDTYFETTKCLYQDFAQVKVVSLDVLEEIKESTPNAFMLQPPNLSMHPIQFGDGTHGSVFLCWDQQYYNSFDLPYSMRYRNFKMPKHIEGAHELKEKLTEGEKDYIIVNRYMGVENNYINYHVDYLNPDNFKVIDLKLDSTNNVLQYVELFKNAKQIHVLPTSFHHLVESMINDVQGQLFFHNARRNFYSTVNNYWNAHRWKIVNYLEKY